tara:strand:+ start:1353 stop:1676 length:324 start_codon:yes stop_codon:yes gene_type:complete
MLLARFALSNEAEGLWKAWLKKLSVEIFGGLELLRTRCKKQIFSKSIEQTWHKLRVNLLFKIHQNYKNNNVLTLVDKKLLVKLRDFHYLLSEKDREILKRVYGYELV